MRVVSLIILLVIVGAIGFVILKWDYFKKKARESYLTAQGYTPAQKPKEALEKFLDAIKNRHYDGAARYCSGDYADQLVALHIPASTLGEKAERLGRYLKEKQFDSEKTTELLYWLEPFPGPWKIKEVIHKEGEDFAVGIMIPDFSPPPTHITPQESKRLDGRIVQVLVWNGTINILGKIKIELEEKKGVKSWFLKLPEINQESYMYLKERYKSYGAGLDQMHEDVRTGRHLRNVIFTLLLDYLEESK